MPRRSLFPFFALTLLVGGLTPLPSPGVDLPRDRPLRAGSMPTVIRDAATVPRAPQESAPALEEPR